MDEKLDTTLISFVIVEPTFGDVVSTTIKRGNFVLKFGEMIQQDQHDTTILLLQLQCQILVQQNTSSLTVYFKTYPKLTNSLIMLFVLFGILKVCIYI